MAAIGLSFLAALGFASAAVLARQGMQAIFPMPGVMVSLFVSFLLAAVMVLLFAYSDISSIPRAAVFWIIGLGVVNFLGGRSQNFRSTLLALPGPVCSYRLRRPSPPYSPWPSPARVSAFW